MISWRSSKVEAEALFLNDRALCSRVDPMAEARNWIRYYRDKMKWTDVIIVLGVGPGYHLDLIESEFPNKKILAFDSHSEVVALHGNKIHLLGDSADLPIEALNRRSVVLPFRPAWGNQIEFYSRIQNKFTGVQVKGRILEGKEKINFVAKELFV